MGSFVEYIISAKCDDTKYGDVARDIVADSAVDVKWGYRQLMRHLESVGACADVISIVKESHEMYKRRII